MIIETSHIKLGVTLGGFVEVGLLNFGGHEPARRGAEGKLASESPAGSQSSNGGHDCNNSCVDGEFTEDCRR